MALAVRQAPHDAELARLGTNSNHFEPTAAAAARWEVHKAVAKNRQPWAAHRPALRQSRGVFLRHRIGDGRQNLRPPSSAGPFSWPNAARNASAVSGGVILLRE